MERHATYVHTFSAPAPARALPPPALATEAEEATALYLRPRARIARPMTWEDIVADRAARGLRTLDEPAPELRNAPRSSSTPTRGPSPSRGPKRLEPWQKKRAFGFNPFAEWEVERRVGRQVSSMADLLSRPEWKGASVVGEAPHPRIAQETARAKAMRAEHARAVKEGEKTRAKMAEERARLDASEGGAELDVRVTLRRSIENGERLAKACDNDAARALVAAEACERIARELAAGGTWVVLRHPSGATVTLDPSKV